MQRWEYKIVYRSELGGDWVVDGQPAAEMGKLEDPEVLAQLGRDGWELVTVVGYTYFLKRPVQPG